MRMTLLDVKNLPRKRLDETIAECVLGYSLQYDDNGQASCVVAGWPAPGTVAPFPLPRYSTSAALLRHIELRLINRAQYIQALFAVLQDTLRREPTDEDLVFVAPEIRAKALILAGSIEDPAPVTFSLDDGQSILEGGSV